MSKSDCCGAPLIGSYPDTICSECKEHCEAEQEQTERSSNSDEDLSRPAPNTCRPIGKYSGRCRDYVAEVCDIKTALECARCGKELTVNNENCQRHKNVAATGCAVCTINERDQLREANAKLVAFAEAIKKMVPERCVDGYWVLPHSLYMMAQEAIDSAGGKSGTSPAALSKDATGGKATP